MYLPIESDKQITNFLTRATTANIENLFLLLGEKFPIKELRKIFIPGKHDSYYYLRLRNLNVKLKRRRRPNKGAKISRELADFIRDFMNQKFSQIVYADIGCGNCKKTRNIGEQLRADYIIGADLRQWSSYKRQIAGIEFRTYEKNGKLPFGDGEVNLVTLIMVLHHVENLEQFLAEISRILPDGGLLIIREHDCRDWMDNTIIDIQHMIYDRVYFPSNDYLEFARGYYKSHRSWIDYLGKFGFKFRGFRDENRPDRAFMAAFVKNSEN